jgi:hypothetical protein
MQPRGGSCSPEEGVTHLVSRGKIISKEKFMPKEELGNQSSILFLRFESLNGKINMKV